LARYRPGYPFPGCVPAEPESVSPGLRRLTFAQIRCKSPLDAGANALKIPHPGRLAAPAGPTRTLGKIRGMS
jgi:hypothetical protein